MSLAVDMNVWRGRIDEEEGEFALRWHQRVRAYKKCAEKGVVLLGFACDEGVRRNHGRPGADQGPRALRSGLANLAWHQTYPVYDAGDILCIDHVSLELAQQKLACHVTEILNEGHFPLVLGGGHETAYGSWCGLADKYPEETIGIINFDAHFDLREGKNATSGTPFAQIASVCQLTNRPFHYLCLGIAEPSNTDALFSKAKKLGVHWRFDHDMNSWQQGEIQQQLLDFIEYLDVVYLTIDLDVLPGTVMPAVSAPAARGVALDVIEPLIVLLAKSGKLALADVVELNPNFDIDGHGVKTAARLCWTLCRCLKL